MSADTCMFEVPVYRVTPDAWQKDATERIRRYAEADVQRRADCGLPVTDHDRLRADMWARYAERVYCWRYNEVIAWVGLLWDGPGPVIKAYLWQVGKPTPEAWEPKRRYQRGFHPFPFFGGVPANRAFEVWAHRDDSDYAIYERLRDRLSDIVAARGDLPRRHIDLTAFDRIGPHVRWRRLVGLDDDEPRGP
jgi:hypothetical protein